MAQRKLAVVVTGGRNYKNREVVFAALDTAQPDLVLHGDCPTGADRLAQEWCNENDVQYIAYPAQWDIHGKAAGPMRSGHMCGDLLKYKVDGYRIGCIAFPGNSGTAACVNHAGRRGIKVWHPTSQAEPFEAPATAREVVTA